MTDSVVRTTVADLDDLMCDEAINDPAVYYAKLRDIDPVYWNSKWNGWVLTGYEAVVTAHRRDTETLSVDHLAGPFGTRIRKSAAQSQNLLKFLSNMFPHKDPPDHTRMRTLVSKALTVKSVEALRPRVCGLVRDLIEPLRDRDDVDFISEFSFSLPLIVIAELLGVPTESRNDLRAWSTDVAGVLAVRADDPHRIQRAEAAMSALVEFLRPIVKARRDTPRDDLLTRMVQAEERGNFLSEDEVIANALTMVIAGHETTTSLLANGVVAFNRFPDQWERLRHEPELARTAVEEILRYDGPIRAMARWAKQPFELCGRTIAAGDRLLVVEYAANHDPAAFSRPELFDIGRWPNRHASFGQGIHTCPGSPLARMEAQETFGYLAGEFESVDVVEDKLHYDRNFVSRSLSRLGVTFRERGGS